MSDFYLMTVLIFNKMYLQKQYGFFQQYGNFYSQYQQYYFLIIVYCTKTPRLFLKNVFFFLERLALFVQLVRGGHKGITKTIVKSTRMTTEQYINVGIHNVNEEDKTQQSSLDQKLKTEYEFNSIQKAAALPSAQLLNSSEPLPSFSLLCQQLQSQNEASM